MTLVTSLTTCGVLGRRQVYGRLRCRAVRVSGRRGAVLVDVCMFGFLTAFLAVGLVVILAPESDFARAVLRLAGVEPAAASPSAAATPPEPMPSVQSVPSEPLPSAPNEPWLAEADDPRPTREVSHAAVPPARNVVQPPSKPDSPHERPEIERFANDADERIDAVQRDYYFEMEGIGWNSVLAPWHIEQDEKLLKCKAIVRQASSMVREYETRSFTLVRELRAEIYRLPISDRSKKTLESIVERYVIDARWGELWELEKRKIAKVGEVIDLLAANKRGVAWKIEGNRLLFAAASSTRTKYNALMAELNRIAEQRQRIHREVHDVRKKRLKEMNRLTENG